MCLVELKGSNKPLISCAVTAKSTLVTNTEIFTNSPIVKKARENILEFLLLNHPLDCPICDQGGECDLQDQSLFFGFTRKRFYNYKRIVVDKNIGPIIKTVMTRCIHCTRCIRFAAEIAGVKSLGAFGRSYNTEIGTYIEKTFQSEISGNVIDICPVGALTSKFYPYSGRIWELKGINSIDFSDGFCLDIILQIKNRKIIKIHPNFNKNEINWISDKTRFSFDGLFTLNSSLKNKKIDKIWLELFNKLVKLFYFYDHLSKHNLKIEPLIIIFGETLNNESLNLLTFFSKMHRFIKIRRNISVNNGNDIEKYFKLNNSVLPINFNSSKFCFLIGVNPRNEGFYLNIKLRQRQLKGNFKIFNMFSMVNLTYSTQIVSTSPKFLKAISEGNHILSQNFISKTKPLLILNQRISNRIDSDFFFNSVFILETYTMLKNRDWSGFNLISNSLNSTGITNLNVFVGVSNKDFLKSSCLFFLNCPTGQSSNLSKLLQLKLLNCITLELEYKTFKFTYFKTKRFTIELSSCRKSQSFYKIPQYLYFPSANFFENSGTFINTLGLSKLSAKVLTSNLEKKTDWEILRILLSNSKSLKLLNSDQKIVFLDWNLNRLRNFIIFLNYASSNISSLSFFLNKKSQIIGKKLFKFQKFKIKIINTKLKRYIYDFYLGTESYYSRFSLIMAQCSNLNRTEMTNFIK
jgi:NADH dehydrogenase/NADH:ubiquinone oxidoreductase subunit G